MLRTPFAFSGTIDRRTYVLVAFAGVLLKHGVDLWLESVVFHRPWSPLDYIIPLGVAVPITNLSANDRAFVLSMLAVSLPFAAVGIAITVKRFRTIGWPLWLSVLFFAPVANIVSFALAAIWPERVDDERTQPPRWLERVVPADTLGAATLAVAAAALLGVVCVALGTRALSSYGWGLFAAIPFSQGAIAAYVYGVHRRRRIAESLGVAMLSMGLTFAALIAVALEGVICVAMAAPLAAALAALGALFGHVLQSRAVNGRIDAAALLVLIAAAPAVMGAEAVVPREAPVYVVRSEIVIDAPPMTVWRNVVRFAPLPPPVEPVFRLGVAYPERAEIVGTGVGATRYCRFSTGDFVEPITVWQAGRRLGFRVARNPEPMRELSPYPGLETPHLHGYMVSRRGEFRLEALPGGRTRLVGTTWYQHHLWPGAYWAVFADAIVHRIHMRVLRHIKIVSELAARRARGTVAPCSASCPPPAERRSTGPVLDQRSSRRAWALGSSMLRGQSSPSKRESARSARIFPPV